jgi:hypothetical protein
MPPKKQTEPASEVGPNGAKTSQQAKRETLSAKKQDEVQEEKIMELKEGEVLEAYKIEEVKRTFGSREGPRRDWTSGMRAGLIFQIGQATERAAFPKVLSVPPDGSGSSAPDYNYRQVGRYHVSPSRSVNSTTHGRYHLGADPAPKEGERYFA